ncbi:NACHT domain-containing protein [Holzapfeliella sp. JNUCC 72]
MDSLLTYNFKKLNDRALNFSKIKWKQMETKFNNNFKKYFKKVSKEYETIPNVLDDTRVNLLERYQPTYLEYTDDYNNKKRVKSDHLNNILDLASCACITGLGGVGKSTTLKYFLLSSFQNKDFYDKKIPVYIELRKYNIEDENKKRRKFLEFIYEEMTVFGFDIDFEYFKFMVQNGRFIFLLDGFDEISSDYSNKLIIEMNDLICKYSDNRYLLTSRKMPQSEYLDTIPNIKKFNISGLDKNQAISMISKINMNQADKKTEFISLLNNSLYDAFSSLASNPILLILMYRTYRKTTKFPEIEAAFLLKIYDILYDEHDATKLGAYKREFKTNLSKSQLLSLFSEFCFQTYYGKSGIQNSFKKRDVSNFLEKAKYGNCDAGDFVYDLSVCLCLIHNEGENWYFVHNIFQEFYAAYFVYTQFSQDDITLFFCKILDRHDAIRLLNTTLKYFFELDETEDKSKFQSEVMYPILNRLKRSPNFESYIDELDSDYIYRIKENKVYVNRTISPVPKSTTSSFLIYVLTFFSKNYRKIRYYTFENCDEEKSVSSNLKNRQKAYEKRNNITDLCVSLSMDQIQNDEQLSKIFKESNIKNLRGHFDDICMIFNSLLKSENENENSWLDDI